MKYEQDDVKGFEEIYGEKLGTFPFEDRRIRMSELAGEALAVPGRCLAFPNAVQHRVAPFASRTRPCQATAAFSPSSS